MKLIIGCWKNFFILKNNYNINLNILFNILRLKFKKILVYIFSLQYVSK